MLRFLTVVNEQYFTTYRTRSLTTSDFLRTLFSFFASDREATGRLNSIDFNAWFYSPGFPPVKPDFDTSLVDACYALADKWTSLSSSSSSPFVPHKDDIAGLKANQLVVFLEKLISSRPQPLSSAQAALMGETYGFGASKNVEISSRYFNLSLRSKYDGVEEPTAELLGRVGRMKFVRPLYRALKDVNRGLAERTFEKNRDFYHPICRNMVEKDLFGSEK